MVAKLILPKFGGAPAVWTAAMVFFQGALLLGYACAHIGVKTLGPKRQSIVHAVIFLAALILLPVVLPKGASVNGSASPTLTVIATLTLMVGLPFLLVSAGASLLQRWFAQTDDPLAQDPYFLYSASNLGSMLGLLSYPLLIEPNLGLAEQSRLWTIGYGILGGLLLLVAILLKEKPLAEVEEGEPEPAPTWQRRLRWVALAAVPSSLLLGATTHITTVIAPIPLLWVVPLAIYLLSFILAFARRKLPTKFVIWPALVVAAPLTIALAANSLAYPKVQLTLHLVALFLMAWACHQTLADDRPSAQRLTEFFFFLALGGVAGGIFNSLVAPLLFKSLAEYPIAVCGVALLLPRPNVRQSYRWLDLVGPIAVGLVAFWMVRVDISLHWGQEDFPMLIVLGVPTALAMAMIWRQGAYALALAAVLVVTRLGGVANGALIASDRSFFGVHDVYFYDHGTEHRLIHGTTMHGLQTSQYPDKPVTYYTQSGPIGQVMSEKMNGGAKPAYAVVGLGAGTMAAYAVAGQSVDFYEIDPTVISMAKNPKYFTYLSDCKGVLQVIEGDARLSLQQAANGRYEVIVLDAFSSDAIPLHLLSKEAIQMYLSKITPTGIIAFHISNRYLDLRAPLANAAKDLGLVAIGEIDDGMLEPFKYRSSWVLLGRSKASFGGLATDPRWSVPNIDPQEPVWTDDRSSVLRTLKKGP